MTLGNVVILSKEKNCTYDVTSGVFTGGELSENAKKKNIPNSVSGKKKVVLDTLLENSENGDVVKYETLYKKCYNQEHFSTDDLQTFKKNHCSNLVTWINGKYGKIEVVDGEGLKIIIPSQVELDSFSTMVRKNARKLVENAENACNITKIDELLLPKCEGSSNKNLFEVLNKEIIASLEQNESKYFYIQAGGGCGKTVSLLYSCKKFMNNDRFFPVFIRMQDVFAEADKPLTSYMFSHLATQNGNVVENYNYFFANLKEYLESTHRHLLIFLDGCDEVSGKSLSDIDALIDINQRETHSPQRWPEKSLSDIDALINMPNTSIIMSSRISNSIGDNFTKITFSPIGIRQIKLYFRNKKINTTNVGKWINSERLRTPFGITKVADILMDNPTAYEKMTTAAAIMEEWIKRDIKKRKFDRDLEFGVSFVLPIIALATFMEMKAEEQPSLKVQKSVYIRATRLVKTIFEDAEFSLLYTEFPVEKNFNLILGDLSKKGLGYINTNYLETEQETVFSWVHENYRDWFIAKGLQVLGKYSKSLFDEYIKIFVEERFYYENSSHEKNRATYSIATYLSEFVEKDGLHVDKEVLVTLLRNIVFIADDLNDFGRVREYSDKVETLLKTGEGTNISSLQQAITLSGIACAKLHDDVDSVKQKRLLVDQADEMLQQSKELILSEIGEAFQNSLSEISNMYDCAPKELESFYRNRVDKNDLFQNENENLKKSLDVLSRIYGNLGASFIRKFDLTKKAEYMKEAFMYHAVGGMVKYFIFYYNAKPIGQYESEAMATTYRSLGVDLIRLKKYQSAIDYFEFAKANFELLSEGFQKGLDLLIIRSKIGGMEKDVNAKDIGDIVDKLMSLVAYFGEKAMIKQIKQIGDECENLKSLGNRNKLDSKIYDKIKSLEILIERAYEQNKISQKKE